MPASDVSSLPSNFGALEVDVHISAYGDAIMAAGGIPLLLPCAAASVEVLSRCDGLVLTGGADVDPARYGADPHPKVYGVDGRRDEVELALLRHALDLGMPVLAVCRGMQLLNVAFGGTLVQHLDANDLDVHAAWEQRVDAPVHTVIFTPGSAAAHCFGGALAVNSLHHQAVDRLGDGLVATGRSSDGTIEAVERPGRPLLGVQWHPELLAAQPDPAFRWIVAAAGRTPG